VLQLIAIPDTMSGVIGFNSCGKDGSMGVGSATYADFLASKRLVSESSGFDVDESELNPLMFPFQRKVTSWALRRGRAAMFEDCGLGKSVQELEWANRVHKHTGGNVLILTPLAVGPQMVREGDKFGIECHVAGTQADVKPGISVTNYERLHHFDRSKFSGLVCDESGILKSYDGSTRKAITEFGRPIPYRLAATATPAPNDLIELTNQSEFLDVMSGKEIIALFFSTDGNSTTKWRLKRHARKAFWRWMASWSVAIRKPSDIGESDDGYNLPPLHIHPVVVNSRPLPGFLFPTEAKGLNDLRSARRDSLSERVGICADIANATDEPFLIWCDLNDESEALAKSIRDSVEVRGSDSVDKKEDGLLGFAEGKYRCLVTKPSIGAWGLNYQHCPNMAFVGLSYSFEAYYQAIRRCWRFGQDRPVHAHVITSEAEGPVVDAIREKEHQAAEMFAEIVENMDGLSLGRISRSEMDYNPQVPMMIPSWIGGC
jgi:hypothetical protein